jgi:hypothetical protein
VRCSPLGHSGEKGANRPAGGDSVVMKRTIIFSVAAIFAALCSQPLQAEDNRGRGKGGGGGKPAAVQAPVNRGGGNRGAARGAGPVARGPSVSAPRINSAPRVNPAPAARAYVNRPANSNAGIANQRAVAASQAAAANRASTANRAAVTANRGPSNIQRSPSVVNRAPAPVAQGPARNAYSAGDLANRGSVADARRWDRNRDGVQNSNRNDHRDWNRNGDRGWSHYRYYHAPYSAYRNWDHNRIYSWNNYRYRYFGDSWVIVDPGYDYDYVETVPSAVAIGGDTVRDVQLELARAGFNPGPADGVLGQDTRNAIADFQADRGLAVTGRIDSPLLEALGLLN